MLRVRAAALAPLLALAATAGCRVEVDGAPCALPGTSADCPDGQACGNDRRCSARALACADSRCAPGDGHCTGPMAFRCTAADPVCGRWERDDCAARGMECGTRGSGACECPAYAGTTLVADPSVPSRRGAAPFPTGQQEPPECRFGRLGDALAAAALAPAAVTVRSAGGALAFGAATAEEWPLLVASGVTVEGVRVDADGATTGVRVSGPGARLVAVEVSGAAGAALEVDVDPAAAATVEVLGGAFRASQVGIWIRGGRVRVAPDPAGASSAVAAENPGSTVVSGNAGDGVVIGGHGPRGLPLTGEAVDATLERLYVGENGGAGLVIAGLPASSRLRVAGCDIHANASSSPIAYGNPVRSAGGVLVSLVPVAGFAFSGNRLWANAGDQLAFESDSTWQIAAPSCGPQTNVFACIPDAGCEVGSCAVSVMTGGYVQAAYSTWPKLPAYPYVTLNQVGGTELSTCTGAVGEPPKPSCP